ncbi:MAG: undecaprenyl-diphosphate phosphatase [Candidatus Omnitrophica bacterium]|nr:undecaprenyl-diphosphate phosphatase [Candidatus Omnitrophota bacterium]
MLKIIFLGALQGLTEFFPVSSSGHLVIAQHFLNIDKDILFLDTFLHIGTILALLTFFLKDIIRAFKSLRTLKCIAVATFATAIIAIVFKKTLESLFASAHYTAIQFMINGVILLLVPFLKKGDRKPGIADSAVMGIAQGVAIIPAISRSGLTIVSLLARGVKKEEAFSFSFIASIPAITGAFLMEAKDIHFSSSYNPRDLTVGLIASYALGILSLFALGKIIKNQKLHLFGYYCILLGMGLLFIFKI